MQALDRLIRETHILWKKAKERAAERCRATLPQVALKLDECQMFQGNESLAEIAELMYSPQGREFMTATQFPSLETFRRYVPFAPEQYDIWIDCGKTEMENPERCIIVGDTQVKITCNGLKAYTIILMHGATADITASGYAVVHVEKDRTSKANIIVHDHAKVL